MLPVMLDDKQLLVNGRAEIAMCALDLDIFKVQDLESRGQEIIFQA